MFINIELNAEFSSIIILWGISETLSSWLSHSRAGCTHRHPSEAFKQQSVNLSFSEFPFLCATVVLHHINPLPHSQFSSYPLLDYLSLTQTLLCVPSKYTPTHTENGWSVKEKVKKEGRKERSPCDHSLANDHQSKSKLNTLTIELHDVFLSRFHRNYTAGSHTSTTELSASPKTTWQWYTWLRVVVSCSH